MTFVIVEDDLKSIEKVKTIISDVLFSYNINYEIKVFNKCTNKLKQEIKDKSTIKTYILSVDLKQDISGIDIAEFIRIDDYNSNIIFLTHHGNMFETAHRNVCNIFEFIEKYQNMDKRLTKDIKKIVNYNMDDKMLCYSYQGSIFKIYLKSIKYITRNTEERKLNIYTDNKIYKCNKSIKEILKLLDKRFIRVSKSTIMNYDYVNELNWSKGYAVLLDNSFVDSVSKRYKR